MSQVIGDLMIQMSADVARLSKDFGEATRLTKLATDQMQSMAGLVKGAVGGMLAGFTVVAFVDQVKSTIKSLSELDDAAERTGASVENLSGLMKQARISGADWGGIEAGMIRLSKALTGADDEAKAVGHALKEVGLSAETLRGMDTAEAFKVVADKLAEYKDGLGKTAWAQDVMGKGGAALLPYLKDLAELSSIAGKRTAEQAAQAEALEKNMRKLQGGMNEFKNGAATAVIPALSDITDWMVKAQKEGGTLYAVLVGIGMTMGKLSGVEINPMARAENNVNEQFAKRQKALADLANTPEWQFMTRGRAQIALNEANKALRAAIAERNALLKDAAAEVDKKFGRPGIDHKSPDKSAGAEKLSDYQKLTRAIAEKTAISEAELATVDKLTEGEKMAAKMRVDLEKGTIKLTEAEQEKIKGDLERLIDAEDKVTSYRRQGEAIKINADNIAAALAVDREVEAQALATAQAWGALTEAIEARALAAETELENYGKTEVAIQAATLARLQEARALTDPAFADHLAYLDREIAARERLLRATTDRSALEANAEAAKKASEEWQKMADDINRSLTDAIMDGGKSGGDLLKNYFKTLILRPIVQMATQPLVGAASNLLGSVAGPMSGAGGAIGSGLNMLSAGNSIGNLFGGGSALGAAFNAAAYSTVGGASFSQAAMLAAQDSVFGAAGTTATLEALGTSSQMSSLLGSLGSAMPYIAAAVAIGSLLMKDGGGPKTELRGGDTLPADIPGSYRPTEALDSLARGIKNDYRQTLRALGLTAADLKLGLGGDSDPQGTANDTAGVVVRSGDQMRALHMAFGRGDWTSTQNLGTVAARALVSALELTDLGDKINAMLDPLDVESLSLERAQQAVAAVKIAHLLEEDAAQVYKDIAGGVDLMAMSADEFKRTLADLTSAETLRKAFTAMGRSADDVGVRLLDMAGGAEKLAANVGTYYSQFYAADEQSRAGIKAIGDQLRVLGVESMPQTRAAFRALVDAQDLSTEAGQRTFASLMSVAGAFAAVTEAASELPTALFKTRADYLYAQKTGQIPAYADGGLHPGGWAQVGEAGPELVELPPSRVHSNSASRALLDLDPLRAELAALRADLRAANAANTAANKRTAKFLDKWDADGMPAVRTA